MAIERSSDARVDAEALMRLDGEGPNTGGTTAIDSYLAARRQELDESRLAAQAGKGRLDVIGLGRALASDRLTTDRQPDARVQGNGSSPKR